MLTLANDQLEVSVLDPVEDRPRLGSRYCTGGYVYAVADRRVGTITSGPGYPDEEPPPVFDGQGLPEAFATPLWVGGENAPPRTRPPAGTPMLVIGVGQVEAVPPEQWRVMPVQEFCAWSVEREPTTLRMQTHQAFAGWELDLTRELTLINRTLISRTRLANVGRDPVGLRWFAHPFFPPPHGEACKFNLPISVPDNAGYRLLDDGWIATKLDVPWDRVGHFLAVPFEPGERLVTTQKHPLLGLLVATCSFTPAWLPIWGNRNTFSFEPYLARTIAPGEDTTWSICYDF